MERLLGGRRLPTARVMALFWIGFTVAYLAFFYVFQDAREIADSSLDGYLEVILLGVPSVVLLGVVLWLHESEADADLQPPLVAWTVGSAVAFTMAMAAALFIVEARFDTGEQWLILLLSMGFGASSGAVTGILGIRSKQREREHNRTRRVARRREREREQLEHLNQYLRHEVLNEVNKIRGYADLLSDRTDDDTAAGHLDIIRNSSEDISVFIESIREVLDATDHDPAPTVVDIVGTIEAEADRVRRAHPETTVIVEAPPEAPVVGGELLERVFLNLVENAVEHNDPGVTVTVSVERTEEWIRVQVTDDGEGVPAPDRERLFEPPRSGDHGYGLFLTANLVELYGGSLELASTGPEGTTFLVHLRAAGTGWAPFEAPAERAAA